MEEFNRQRLMENVNELIKQKGLKVGEVESGIGVSAGYISRLTKKETDSAPSADIVWKLAKYLGVSTDLLIEGDFSKATHNLQYMRNFVLKLKKMTDSNEIEWDVITVQDVDKALQREDGADEVKEELPIIAKWDGILTEDGATEKGTQYLDCSLPSCGNKRVKSAATEDTVWLCGSGFRTLLEDGTAVFLFRMEGNIKINREGKQEVLDFYDIYFGKNVLNPDFEGYHPPDEGDYEYTFLPVCSTLNNAHDIEADVALLYRSISRHERDLKISAEVRSSIDAFLRPKSKGVMDEDLPFN